MNILKPSKYLFMLGVFISLLVAGCEKPEPEEKDTVNTSKSVDERLGTHFEKIQNYHFKAPSVNKIDALDELPGAAIWGATGKDAEGNIYFGASTYAPFHDNAYLYRYNPQQNKFVSEGDVLSQLKQAQLYKEGLSQSTLHTKLYLADDGYLYFASSDTLEGNSANKEISEYASFFWRKKPQDDNWEHILSTRETIVAINTDGRYVYLLGNPGHVVYQLDTLSKRMKRVTVGSTSKHISRNFLVGNNGSIFIPRLQTMEDGSHASDLMEYNTQLNLVDIHPMEHYYRPSGVGHHGIVSYTNMKNGNIYFATSLGALYEIKSLNKVKHQLNHLGFIDETGKKGNYIPSMFSIDGENFLVALGKIPKQKHYHWFIHELSTSTTVAYPMPDLSTQYLLYGSVTRDNSGKYYVTGVDASNRNQNKAAIIQLYYP